METYKLNKERRAFGVQVKNFPSGIGQAFESLVKMFPKGDNRSYFGIFRMGENGNMIYYATAEEKFAGEAEKYKCDVHIVEKGTYLTEAIHNWREKTDSIQDVFRELTRDPRADRTKPGVEWYKDDKNMLCMVRSIHQD